MSFAYQARPQEQVLEDIDLTIKTGTSVYISGASGSGKSTIAAVISRLYDPAHGCINVGGHSIPDYNSSSLRNQIALVDQDRLSSLERYVRTSWMNSKEPEVLTPR